MAHDTGLDRNARVLRAETQHARCPYCNSAHIAVPTKRTPSSYSRCEACGQLWHPDRLPRTGGRR